MTNHVLSQIELEEKIAFCSVCLWTEIHVSESRIGKAPKAICMKRFQEIQKYQKRWGETRRKNVLSKPHHLLSEIDPVNMIANCSVCGPAEIRKEGSKYKCANLTRANQRKYRRTHYSSRVTNPNLHVLSQIDEDHKTAVCSICGPVEIYIWLGERKILRRCSNAPVTGIPGAIKIRWEINIDIINLYKIAGGCSCCGYKANLHELELWNKNPMKKAPKLKKLLLLNRSDLMQKLAECDVLCLNCYPFPPRSMA